LSCCVVTQSKHGAAARSNPLYFITAHFYGGESSQKNPTCAFKKFVWNALVGNKSNIREKLKGFNVAKKSVFGKIKSRLLLGDFCEVNRAGAFKIVRNSCQRGLGASPFRGRHLADNGRIKNEGHRRYSRLEKGLTGIA
jgi:hypothetical protein